MQDFLSIMPALISLAIVSLLVLTGASLFLIRDLSRMQRERQEGIFSVWYRRPTTRNSLKGIGYALLVVVGTVWWGWSDFLPSDLSNISGIGLACVIAGILLVMVSISLISDLSNLRGKRREGQAFVWYQQPKILRGIGKVTFSCSILLEGGYVEYVQLARYFLHTPYYQSSLPGIVSASILFLLSLVLYCLAAAIQMKNRHNRSYEI